jgi:hypothetical protein
MFQLLQQKNEQNSSAEANRTVQMLTMWVTTHVVFSIFQVEVLDTPENKYKLMAMATSQIT